MDITFALTVITQPAHMGSQFRIVGYDCASVTHRTQVLTRIEAEPCNGAKRSGFLPFTVHAVSSAMCLAGILDHCDCVLISQLHQWLHISWKPVQMDWHNGGNPAASFQMDNFAVIMNNT